jgi:hypothetical protein
MAPILQGKRQNLELKTQNGTQNSKGRNALAEVILHFEKPMARVSRLLPSTFEF